MIATLLGIQQKKIVLMQKSRGFSHLAYLNVDFPSLEIVALQKPTVKIERAIKVDQPTANVQKVLLWILA